MTADTGIAAENVAVARRITARDAAADASAEAGIVSEVSIASAAATISAIMQPERPDLGGIDCGRAGLVPAARAGG